MSTNINSRLTSRHKTLLMFFLVLLIWLPSGAADTAAVAQPQTPDADWNKIYDVLDAQLDNKSDAPVKALIVLQKPLPDMEIKQLVGTNSDVELLTSYKSFPVISVRLSKAQAKRIASDKRVKHVENDAKVTAMMSTASQNFGVTAARTDLNVTGDRNGAPKTYTSSDVVIAVVDSGVDSKHVDLDGQKVIGWKDFINNRSTPYDDNGHGAHVSGIAAGEGDGNSSYRGVAPGAAIVGVKVLNKYGSGSTSQVLNGIDWVIQNRNKYNIEIMNMSLGTSGSSNGNDSISVAVNNAFDAGILPVVAAGNAGPNAYTVGSPGAAEKAVSVCAMADPGNLGFFLADFSSRGPTKDNRIKPDICGAGYSITSVNSGSTNGYTALSGTSMASPFVAGVAALMLDAEPTLSLVQIKNGMYSSAIDWGPIGKDNEYGYGRLDAYLAVSGVTVASAPVVPDHFRDTEDLFSSKQKDVWKMALDGTSPIAVTAIHANWSGSSSPNFDIYLLNSSKAIIKSYTGTTRQDTLTYKPNSTGTYYVAVFRQSGSGVYHIDISADMASTPVMYKDDYTGTQ